MIEEKKQEFLEMYEENKKYHGTIPSREEVFMTIVKLFIDSEKVSDKKSAAKLILKSKPSMKDHRLWEFIDEDLLNQIVKTKAP